MEPKEIRKLRINQLLLTNVMLLIILVLFFTLSSLFTITFYHFFFTIGVIILIQTIYGFLKRDSTKSIIPLLEKVSIYEKQKMGIEWLKSRRANTGWSIVLSGLMFIQGYMSLGYEDNVFYFEPIFMIILTSLICLSLISVCSSISGKLTTQPLNQN